MATNEKIFKKIVKNLPLARFQNYFTEIVVGWPSYKIDIFVEKHGRQWAWLVFPYISIVKSLNIIFSEITGWISL